MPKIQFTTNIPVELRLQSIEGELTPSQFGGNQIKFTAHEGPFWVSEAVGSILIDQIRKKRIQPHVPVEVARREIAQSNGRKGIQWTIDLVGFIPGEQPDGTFAVAANGNGANGSHPPAPQAAPKTQPSCADNNGNGNANRVPVVGRPVPASGNGVNGNGTNGSGHAATGTADGWAAYIRHLTQAADRVPAAGRGAADRGRHPPGARAVGGHAAALAVNCPKRPGAGGAIPRCKQSSEIPRFGRPKSYRFWDTFL